MNKTPTPDFDDDLSDLLSGNGPVRTPKTPPASYKPVSSYITEKCTKCHGTGRFVGYSGRDFGQCHACRGKGERTFKSTAAQREQARFKAGEKRVEKVREKAKEIEAWKAAHPAAWKWIQTNVQREPQNEFALSLLNNGLNRHGSLTDNQLAAVERNIAKAAARVEAAPAVETAGIDRLKAAFDKAAAYTAAKAKGLTVRNPKITIGGMTISPAKSFSKNPGALYVKDAGVYIGKVMDGKFLATLNCSQEQTDRVLKFIADPAEAAKVYGQETGVCCVCNAELRSEWRLRGIGPICAEKFGW